MHEEQSSAEISLPCSSEGSIKKIHFSLVHCSLEENFVYFLSLLSP